MYQILRTLSTEINIKLMVCESSSPWQRNEAFVVRFCGIIQFIEDLYPTNWLRYSSLITVLSCWNLEYKIPCLIVYKNIIIKARIRIIEKHDTSVAVRIKPNSRIWAQILKLTSRWIISPICKLWLKVSRNWDAWSRLLQLRRL